VSGEVIGDRLELRELLGRGGMSEVWLAEDRKLGRLVAVKLLAGGGDPARLIREARAIAALSHPNIAGVYDVGEAGGRQFIVLEYLPGGTLEDRLTDERPLPDWETERLAEQIAAGLAHAHANGIVHRDLKPSNVLFDAEGRAKLADFGIARAAGQVTLTDAGTVMGTAAYLSPEQAEGRPAGPAADVYSFGVILFRLLTGHLPFTGSTPIELALKHQGTRPPSVRSLRPGAPAGLAAIAERALAKSPEARPANGSQLAALLGEPATAVLPPAADPTLVLRPKQETGATHVLSHRIPPPAGRPPRRDGRRLAALLAVLALLAGGGVLAAVLAAGWGDDPPPAAPVTGRATTTTTVPATTPQEPTTSEQTTTEQTTTAETTVPTGTTSATTTTVPTDVTATTGP
jgi:serine/threonine protein kinase